MKDWIETGMTFVGASILAQSSPSEFSFYAKDGKRVEVPSTVPPSGHGSKVK